VIVLQEGSRRGAERKNAQSNVIAYLAENGPENMYKIGKQTSLYYSSVHKVINTFLLTGIVQPKSSTVSQKNVKTISYSLTFKGVLKYLSTFKIIPESFTKLTKLTKKDVDEHKEKFDKEHNQKLLNVIETQGKILDYAPFQECRWLLKRDPGIIRLFINEAQITLNPSLNNTSQFPDNFNKHLSNPDFPFGVDDLLILRNFENLTLRDKFGKVFLLNVVGSIKMGAENGNEKLRQFAGRLLNEERAKISLLEQAVRLFSRDTLIDEKQMNH
jgi:hypothetical protein